MSLGGQTVTVITRVRGRHNEYRDGTRTAWRGCSVQAQPDSVQEFTDREQRTEARYRLFAPAGFHAQGQDQIEVVPGPVDATGQPCRLELVGQVEPMVDDEGQVDHVAAILRRRSG